MTIYERILNEEFQNDVPYPGDIQDAKAMETYRLGRAAALTKFREALEKEFGTAGHAKADLLWKLSWEFWLVLRANAAPGLETIAQNYESFVQLIT